MLRIVSSERKNVTKKIYHCLESFYLKEYKLFINLGFYWKFARNNSNCNLRLKCDQNESGTNILGWTETAFGLGFDQAYKHGNQGRIPMESVVL